MSDGDGPRVAVFRPDDERLKDAVDLLTSQGLQPVADPMLAVEATGALPRSDAAYVIFTSKTGAELVGGAWSPDETTICAIGGPTADALDAVGIDVDLVPAEYSSTGLVDMLGDRVAGTRVEIARSDHGSDVLPDGLVDAGAYVHETVLYRLVRPEAAGESVSLAASGALDAALFTSTLTVEHFLAIANERGCRDAVLDGLADAVVGAIGEPTRETARREGIAVDVVPDTAEFSALVAAVVTRLTR